MEFGAPGRDNISQALILENLVSSGLICLDFSILGRIFSLKPRWDCVLFSLLWIPIKAAMSYSSKGHYSYVSSDSLLALTSLKYRPPALGPLFPLFNVLCCVYMWGVCLPLLLFHGFFGSHSALSGCLLITLHYQRAEGCYMSIVCWHHPLLYFNRVTSAGVKRD